MRRPAEQPHYYEAARRIAALGVVLCAAVVLTVGYARAQGTTVETALKATYLYKFPPFVEWPAGALSSADTFTLCIVGNDPFGVMLDRAVSGQRIKDRPIVIRRMAAFAPDAGCQIIYATGSAVQPVSAILAAIRGKPILSVTDGGADAQTKGILNFVIADNRVRFEVDDQAAAGSGLTISSKLLGLAIDVRSRN